MEIEINVPQTLSEITLRQYQAYEKVLSLNKEDDNSDRFITLKLIEIFCGITYEQAEGMKLSDFSRIGSHLYDLIQQTPKLVLNFTLGDTKFGFIPNLEEMTFGEYIDLDQYIGDVPNLHKAMAVLYRPIKQQHKKQYTLHNYEGDLLHEAMLDTPLDAVISSILFFYRLGIDCTNAMMNSMNKGLTKELQQVLKEDLRQSGVGINQSMLSLREILQDLKISPSLT